MKTDKQSVEWPPWILYSAIALLVAMAAAVAAAAGVIALNALQDWPGGDPFHGILGWAWGVMFVFAMLAGTVWELKR